MTQNVLLATQDVYLGEEATLGTTVALTSSCLLSSQNTGSESLLASSVPGRSRDLSVQLGNG